MKKLEEENEQLAALGSHSKIYISVWNPHTRIPNLSEMG